MSKVLMDSETLRKQATYIAATDKILEHQEGQEEALQAAVPKVAELLVERGLLSGHRKEAKVKELVDDPVELVSVIEKLGELSAPRTQIGGPAADTEKSASVEMSADDRFAERMLAS